MSNTAFSKGNRWRPTNIVFEGKPTAMPTRLVGLISQKILPLGLISKNILPLNRIAMHDMALVTKG